MVTPLCSGQGHMSVGRERLLVLSCGLPSHPLKILFFARRETIESFCLSFLHTSRQKCVKQMPDRRPPQITGRRVSAVHQGGVGAPNELATFRVHHAVVDFIFRRTKCVENTKLRCVNYKICSRISQADVGQDRREKLFFSGILERLKKKKLPNRVHRRPFRQSLAGIFGNFKLLAFHCHRSYGNLFRRCKTRGK